jgi:CRISPR-associated protein Cas2
VLVHRILKRYLQWVQNSVFEGEITLGKLEDVRNMLSNVIDEDKDSIIVYSVNNAKWLEKVVWGRLKGKTNNVL